MNHDDEYNNGNLPQDKQLPWFDSTNNDGETSAIAEWTNAFFATIYDVLRSLEYAIGGIETFINTTEFM